MFLKFRTCNRGASFPSAGTHLKKPFCKGHVQIVSEQGLVGQHYLRHLHLLEFEEIWQS